MRSVSAGAMVRSVFMMVVLSLPLHASAAGSDFDKLDRGPKVGTAIPHSLRGVDQHNRHQDFKSLARRRGLIVLFSRSLDW